MKWTIVVHGPGVYVGLLVCACGSQADHQAQLGFIYRKTTNIRFWGAPVDAAQMSPRTRGNPMDQGCGEDMPSPWDRSKTAVRPVEKDLAAKSHQKARTEVLRGLFQQREGAAGQPRGRVPGYPAHWGHGMGSPPLWCQCRVPNRRWAEMGLF